MWELFERWGRRYPDSFSSRDKLKRFEAFKSNAVYIQNHNKKGKPHMLALNCITTAKKYPYKAKDEKCDAKKVKLPAVRINGHARVLANDEYALLKAVANQPVSALIDSSSREFKFYSHGLFKGKCGKKLNHAVTIVGYGTSVNGTKYWLVKNSWGPNWGEKGNVRMQRDIDDEAGLCGIAMGATYPVKMKSPTDHDEL
ncbi:hypothetical protein DH2020_042665 [Rehmannia glutinosa]|uniref:Peptidase C1A papain C-terminal domain-containing protein n=1 Tax=Rehmannia glutinosa TaxID=99300 RepID=A0ABR0ULU6_REHGL